MIKINLRGIVITSMILLAAFSRIIPHLPNFSPLGAIGLFGAAHFTQRWKAFLVPVAAAWLSDVYINNVIYHQYYPQFTWFYKGCMWQYGSYLAITLSGMYILKRISIPRVVLASLVSTAIFFLISNFGVWLDSSLYPGSFEGLLLCYLAGIPFLSGTLMGDLAYSTILFIMFDFAQRRIPSLRSYASI
ncbi:MAG TPA: DUF6580 family putative transport protein [Cyclobacteriaceae bacterium]|nr:DUF6580 family putative transport protein [Cyclobacteriaceae bacterium]